MKQLFFIILVFFLACTFNKGLAQSYQTGRTVISSLGGSYGGSSYTGDFTISELAINTFNGVSGKNIISQGFHQGAELIKVKMPEKASDDMVIKAYPNPVRDVVTISFSQKTDEMIELRLFSLSGQLVKTIEMNAMLISVDMSELKSGTYFIHAVNKSTGKRINTVKTQKL